MPVEQINPLTDLVHPREDGGPVAGFKGAPYGGIEFRGVVVGTADEALRTDRQRSGEELVDAVDDIVFAVAGPAAVLILIKIVVVEFDAGEVRNPPVGLLQKFHHRKIHAGIHRVVVVERQFRSRRSRRRAELHQRFDTAGFEVAGRNHRSGVKSQTLRLAAEDLDVTERKRTGVGDELQPPARGSGPRLHDRDAFRDGAGDSLAGGSTDVGPLDAVGDERIRLTGDHLAVEFTVCMKCRERSGDQSGKMFDFHDMLP